jgi:outer membrane cobalamin receptor
MDVQTSVGFEYSQISQTGGENSQDGFFRPKGFIQASYKINEKLAVRPRIAREVGQLNFNDFISSVSLRDALSNAGNKGLVPEQTWASEVEVERIFTKGNIIKVRVYADFISDLVDRIPIGTNGDAVGNIDSALRYGLDIDATLKGEAFGLDGVQMDATLELRKSSVDDPLTSQVRRLNSDKITLWEISLRHDIKGTNWVYGGTISDISRSLTFRLDTISSPSGGQIQTKPKLSAFIEHKDILGLKLKAEIINMLNAKDVSDRQLFTNRRDLGQVDILETSRRHFGQTLRLSISGAF